MLSPGSPHVQRWERQRALANLADHPALRTDADKLTLFRQNSDCTGHDAVLNLHCSYNDRPTPRWMGGWRRSLNLPGPAARIKEVASQIAESFAKERYQTMV
jgi:hypothetical protein